MQYEAQNTSYLKEHFNEVISIDREGWKQELLLHEELFTKLYDKIPKEFIWIRELLLSGLWRSPEKWELASER